MTELYLKKPKNDPQTSALFAFILYRISRENLTTD